MKSTLGWPALCSSLGLLQELNPFIIGIKWQVEFRIVATAWTLVAM